MFIFALMTAKAADSADKSELLPGNAQSCGDLRTGTACCILRTRSVNDISTVRTGCDPGALIFSSGQLSNVAF